MLILITFVISKNKNLMLAHSNIIFFIQWGMIVVDDTKQFLEAEYQSELEEARVRLKSVHSSKQQRQILHKVQMYQVRLHLSLELALFTFLRFFSNKKLFLPSQTLYRSHITTQNPITYYITSLQFIPLHISSIAHNTLSSRKRNSTSHRNSAETGLFGRRVIRLRLLDESRGHKFRCGGVVRITFPKSNTLEEKVRSRAWSRDRDWRRSRWYNDREKVHERGSE